MLEAYNPTPGGWYRWCHKIKDGCRIGKFSHHRRSCPILDCYL